MEGTLRKAQGKNIVKVVQREFVYQPTFVQGRSSKRQTALEMTYGIDKNAC
jgi:hypothetical protein